MDRFVERSYARALSSPPSTAPPAGDIAADTAKMAAAPDTPERPQQQPQPPPAPAMAETDPTSPANIAQAVVQLLGPTLTATVDAAVHRGLEQLHIELQAQAQRITQVEERISIIEDDCTASSAALARINASYRDIWDKLDDLENHSRRNNLRIIGLPESIPASHLTNICAKTIPEQLGLRIPCTVERAHRMGQYSDTRAKPRHVIVKYLNYADKNAIMQKFRRTRSLVVDGAKLLLFADYSIEVMKQRKAFSSVCSTLHRTQTRFSLAYPAVLRVQTSEGEQLTFHTPEEAETYLTNRSSEMEHSAATEGSPSSSSQHAYGPPKHPRSPTKPPYKRSRSTNQEDHSGNR